MFLILVVFYTIVGCKQRNSERHLLVELINEFPQLKGSSQSSSNDFHLVRKVSFGEPSICIELFSQPDSVDDKQQFILVTNSKLQSYGIPLLSNTFRDYWNFLFDSLNSSTEKTNTTFERELNMCFNTLNLNDTIGTPSKIVHELLYSVLYCQEIELSDSSNLLGPVLNDNNIFQMKIMIVAPCVLMKIGKSFQKKYFQTKPSEINLPIGTNKTPEFIFLTIRTLNGISGTNSNLWF
jgi:hypothetical protein